MEKEKDAKTKKETSEKKSKIQIENKFPNFKSS